MHITKEQVIELLHQVRDPEIPVLSVVDMAIIRNITISSEGIVVQITPTYSGCPAMHVIEQDIQSTLQAHGLKNIRIELILDPPWTTDWMSDIAKTKLQEYGIAPPHLTDPANEQLVPLSSKKKKIDCPFCNSSTTIATSEFGSTPCKSYYFCNDCRQPFEYFKSI